MLSRPPAASLGLEHLASLNISDRLMALFHSREEQYIEIDALRFASQLFLADVLNNIIRVGRATI